MDKRTALLLIMNGLLVAGLLYRIRKRKPVPNFLVLIASCFIFLSITEFIYRVFFRRTTYEVGACSQDFFKPDSTLGYVLNHTGTCAVAKVDQRGDTLYKATYTLVPAIDPAGRPVVRRVGLDKAGMSPELVFFGCSFTFGQGLDDTMSLPYQTGKATGLPAVNLGVTGYGIHQVYQSFRQQYAGTPNHQRVFVYSFLYDHIIRANGVYEWNRRGPIFDLQGDSLVYKGSFSGHGQASADRTIHYVSGLGTFSFLKDMLQRVALNRAVKQLGPADYDRCIRMIREMGRTIRQTGGRLIVLHWDQDNWANLDIKGLPQGLIEEKLQALSGEGISLIPVSSVLDLQDPQHFISRDGHPSALANAKIARHLQDQLTQPH